MTGPLRRVLAITALVAVLVGTGVLDRVIARPAPPTAPGVRALSSLEVAPTPGTESSAWFCAGGSGAQGGAPATIVLTNVGRHPVHGTVSAISAPEGAAQPAPWAGARTMALTVPTDGQVTVGAAQLGSTGLVAAAVVLDGGGVAVSEAVQSPLGWSMAPCSPSTAADWYFAHGATTEGGGLILSLFNPTATDAVVNISLVSTTAGYLVPAAYQGIDVGPGSVVTENIGDHDPQDAAVATVVAALSGSLVATELQSVGTPGNGGISLTLGAPAPASLWVFPQSTEIPGGAVAFHVLNPSTSPAVVSVAVGLSLGAGAEPLTLRVAPQSLVTLNAGSQTRIPTGVPYALTFSSPGTGIVVSRQVRAPAGSPAAVPEAGDVSGVPGGSRRWLLPAVVAPGSGAWSLAVVDLGARAATVRITTPSGKAIAGQSPRRVTPGSPLVIGPHPGAPFGTTSFEVRADQPVAVELDALPVAQPGVVVVPSFVAPS
ncbi:MAG TPA: hypothetical protein VN768_06960 [Acidimicrobiales bacterium]|nr:hypothetical protein [Acidimicrobiales bacterium]